MAKSYHVEWGTVKAGTRSQHCTIFSDMVVTSKKQAVKLAQSVLHTLTNGGSDKPIVQFEAVSENNPRIVAWTNNGLSFVSVSLIGILDAPFVSNQKRSPASICSAEAEALGFATDAQMREHQNWLLRNANTRFGQWVVGILGTSILDNLQELRTSATRDMDLKLNAEGWTFVGVTTPSSTELHFFGMMPEVRQPFALEIEHSGVAAIERLKDGQKILGYVQDDDGNKQFVFIV